MACEAGFPLFDAPISEWSNNQVRFAYWMQFYDSVYQADDCPDERVIADNHLLDRWFEGKIKEQEAYRRGVVRGKRGMDSKSAFNHDSVIIY